MTTVRTVAVHEVVEATFPRPVTERDQLGMAVGKAIDETLSRFSHEFRLGRRPTLTSMHRMSVDVLDRELAETDVTLTPNDRNHQLESILGVLQAFRRSPLMGLARPRSRLILIDGSVGVYAQPDYWDGRDHFYEMKSYLARPIPPDVGLQLELFQCAFPGFQAVLASFDRHATPVTTTLEAIPPLDQIAMVEVLKGAFHVGRETGVDKVLEYVDNPVVRYTLPSGPPPATGGSVTGADR